MERILGLLPPLTRHHDCVDVPAQSLSRPNGCIMEVVTVGAPDDQEVYVSR